VSESVSRYGAEVPSPEALDELTASLQRLGRLLASRQATARVTAAANVDVSQQGAALLRTLLRNGRLPMAALATAAAMDLGAVSRQVRVLEGAGAVRRSSDPSDGRVARLELTPKGRRMAEGLRAVGVRHLETALSGWSEADGRTLATLLGRLVDDLVATPVPASTRRRGKAAQE
jgi:DNA-binding MarR family transcriptional regulator